MTKEEKKVQSLVKMRNMKVSMIIGYGIIVLIAIIGVSIFAVRENETVLKNKVTTMTSTLGVQMKLNLENYLSRTESFGTLAFSVENAYSYDGTDPSNDEYEAINIEKDITNDLKELCLMENFVDYGIVYRDNRTVGKVSNGTTSLFGDNLFTGLESMISRTRTQDGWRAGYDGNFERIYYVKKIHENALIVISFYTTELESVFDNPDTMSDMAIRLVSPEYKILYSSIQDEVGNNLPEEIRNRAEGREYSAVMDDTYLTTVNICNEGWYVICSIPASIIMQEREDMQKYIMIAAAIAAFVAIVAGAIFSIRMADPVANVVSSLSGEMREDGFSEVLGSKFFREQAINAVAKSSDDDIRSVIIFSVDDFMDITCNIGREFSDGIINNAVNEIKKYFKDAEYTGRLSENTFCVLTKPSSQSGSSYRTLISKKCMDIGNAFRSSIKGSDGYEYKVSMSIGVASSPENGTDFNKLYDCAYKALYVSQARGQDTFTIYDNRL